jgi:hypothetical protein
MYIEKRTQHLKKRKLKNLNWESKSEDLNKKKNKQRKYTLFGVKSEDLKSFINISTFS